MDGEGCWAPLLGISRRPSLGQPQGAGAGDASHPFDGQRGLGRVARGREYSQHYCGARPPRQVVIGTRGAVTVYKTLVVHTKSHPLGETCAVLGRRSISGLTVRGVTPQRASEAMCLHSTERIAAPIPFPEGNRGGMRRHHRREALGSEETRRERPAAAGKGALAARGLVGQGALQLREQRLMLCQDHTPPWALVWDCRRLAL